MKCRDFEDRLCDYMDDSLNFDERRTVEDHLIECADCTSLHADAEFAGRALREAPAVEAPVELVADIIHGTIGYAGRDPLPVVVGGPLEDGPLARFLRPIFSPVLEPRFVMSMAMTVLSFSMLTFQAQNLWQRWQAGDFLVSEAVESVEEQVESAWASAIEFYDSALMLYRLQTPFAEPAEQSPNQDGADGR